MTNKVLFVVLTIVLLYGCQDDVLPKPKAMLRLEYPSSEYELLDTKNFQFQRNRSSELELNDDISLTLDYPTMKGSLFITYKEVGHDLEELMTDARKLAMEHAIKADGIVPHPFVNGKEKVYGNFFEVVGDAASQAQFYATDSTRHFVTGSLYFYVRPNYDSIYPAASYLQNDIRKIMETLKWK